MKKTIGGEITKLFDPYDRKARLFPSLLALTPVFTLLLCRYGEKVTFTSSIVSLLISCGALFWIARVARNAGVKIQEKMWKPWGGTPTIRYLRHREVLFSDPLTKERCHGVLASGIGKKFPTPAEEEADPIVSDHLYRSGIKWLMEQTRDPKKYSHLLKENIAYGFHRNMLGLKPMAIIVALGCLILSLLWTGLLILEPPFVHPSRANVLSFEQVIAVLLPAAALFLWTFGVTLDSVESASSAYAERLLQACEGLAMEAKKTAAKPKKNPAKPKKISPKAT